LLQLPWGNLVLYEVIAKGYYCYQSKASGRLPEQITRPLSSGLKLSLAGWISRYN
jgi:hypothetical protein